MFDKKVSLFVKNNENAYQLLGSQYINEGEALLEASDIYRIDGLHSFKISREDVNGFITNVYVEYRYNTEGC